MLRKILVFVVAAALTVFAQEKRTEFYYQRASLFDVLPIDSTQIVFLGNSLTNGAEWHELLGMPNVVNRGISGDVVSGVRERIAPVIAGKPAKIFLLTGVNDVSHDLTADSIATALVDLVDYIAQGTPATKIYVQSLLPINNSYGRYKKIEGKEETVRQINAMLEEALADRPATWINLYPLFADENGNLRTDLTNDGLHLMGQGYLIWRDAVLPYVKE